MGRGGGSVPSEQLHIALISHLWVTFFGIFTTTCDGLYSSEPPRLDFQWERAAQWARAGKLGPPNKSQFLS